MSLSSTRIRSVEFEPLNVPLLEPFVIAIGRLDEVRNVLLTVTLENGVIGYGEAAPLEPINGENQATVQATLKTLAPLLVGRDALAETLCRTLWPLFGPKCRPCRVGNGLARCSYQNYGYAPLQIFWWSQFLG
jgi:L-alanine-DL-glutamate epimerase-like enolase superfamily enzyme